MEPARRRDKRADFAAALLLLVAENPEPSVGVPGLGLKGLVEGVGLAVLGMREDDGIGSRPPGAAEGENREGRVPARARRVVV